MKEFYELANELCFEKDANKAKRIWEENNFTVISFGAIKQTYMGIIKTKEQAHKFNLYNDICDNDPEMKKIYDTFQRIVFKESRGNSQKMVIGWENLNSYLRYHSTVCYKWIE